MLPSVLPWKKAHMPIIGKEKNIEQLNTYTQ